MFADDFRLFCGDLGNEVNDDVLSKAFSRFPSFNMARVSFFIFVNTVVLKLRFGVHEPSACPLQMYV